MNERDLHNNEKFTARGDHNSNVSQTTIFDSNICKAQRILENSCDLINCSDQGQLNRLSTLETKPKTIPTIFHNSSRVDDSLDSRSPCSAPQFQNLKNSSRKFFPFHNISVQKPTISQHSSSKTNVKDHESISHQMARFPSGVVEICQAVLLVVVSILSIA